MSAVPQHTRAGWLSIGRRNGASYAVLPTVGVLLAVSIWIYRWVITIIDKLQGRCDGAMWAGCDGSYPVLWVFVSVVFTVGLTFLVLAIVFIIQMMGSYTDTGETIMEDPDPYPYP